MSLEDRSVWRERLGTYLLGVAIGLMLVGALLWGRYRAGQQQRAADAARGTQTGTNNPPTNPP